MVSSTAILALGLLLGGCMMVAWADYLRTAEALAPQHCLLCVQCLPHMPRNRYKLPKPFKIDKGKCPDKGCQEYHYLQQILYIFSFVSKTVKCFNECWACKSQVQEDCPKIKPLKKPYLLKIYATQFDTTPSIKVRQDEQLCCNTEYRQPEPYDKKQRKNRKWWYPVYLVYPSGNPNTLKTAYQLYTRAKTCKESNPTINCERRFHEGNMLMTSTEPDPQFGHTLVIFDSLLSNGMGSNNIQFMSVKDVNSFCMCLG